MTGLNRGMGSELPAGVAVVRLAPDLSDLPARVGPRTFVALVSRGAATDETGAAEGALIRPRPYIGMMGSRRKVRTVLDEPEGGRHIAEERLARVHAPHRPCHRRGNARADCRVHSGHRSSPSGPSGPGRSRK